MPRDEVEHGVGRVARECDQLFAVLAAEHRCEIVWVVFEARDYLTAIAARCTEPRLLCFQHDRPHAALDKMKRRREAGISATDHTDVGLHGLGECRRERRRGCGCGP